MRIEAVSMLAGVPADQLSAERRTALERASEEYLASQRSDADRAEARVNLGKFYAGEATQAKAETEFKAGDQTRS